MLLHASFSLIPDSMAIFYDTDKGGQRLSYKHFTYYKVYERNNSVYWSCILRRTNLKCNGSAVSSNSGSVRRVKARNIHNHDPEFQILST